MLKEIESIVLVDNKDTSLYTELKYQIRYYILSAYSRCPLSNKRAFRSAGLRVKCLTLYSLIARP